MGGARTVYMLFIGRVFLITVISALVAVAVIAMVPFISPGFSSEFMCPLGSTIDPDQYLQNWKAPLNKEISIQCIDSSGVTHLDPIRSQNGFWQLFLIFFFIILVISSLVYLGVYLLVPNKEDPKKKRRYSQY